MGDVVKRIVSPITDTVFGEKKPKSLIRSQRAAPTPDDEAAKKARRRAVAEQVLRSGRESTILSSTDKLGA